MLILMRHGEAGWDASSDRERVLTEAGIAYIDRQITHYQQSLLSIEKIISSSYARAKQTASQVHSIIPEAQWVIDDRWSPDAPLSDAIAALEEHWVDNLLVVTHQPLIGYAVPFLAEGVVHTPEPLLPGQLVVLDLLWPASASAIRLSL
ncbi:SixA phosphatase family protein [Neptunomonas japonica]|uniref:Phosphohistidine phosphatase n=1 Tax=Neptunomonas japonica JAMM 1380 TaxID=1441457 RepID=A0A7R6SVM3_9GAMM|nr:histidine phosphatase family protein [Neptunomonas japonica]BBB29575.1 phosphohistidine phosphatase [Neptunomonas japonica JAMM 1380]